MHDAGADVAQAVTAADAADGACKKLAQRSRPRIIWRRRDMVKDIPQPNLGGMIALDALAATDREAGTARPRDAVAAIAALQRRRPSH